MTEALPVRLLVEAAAVCWAVWLRRQAEDPLSRWRTQ